MMPLLEIWISTIDAIYIKDRFKAHWFIYKWNHGSNYEGEIVPFTLKRYSVYSPQVELLYDRASIPGERLLGRKATIYTGLHVLRWLKITWFQ